MDPENMDTASSGWYDTLAGPSLPNGSFVTGIPTSGFQVAPNTGSVMNTVGQAVGLGQSIFGTVAGYNIAQQQVSRGQIPTALGTSGQLAGTANVSSTANLSTALGLSSGTLLIGMLLLFAVFIFTK